MSKAKWNKWSPSEAFCKRMNDEFGTEWSQVEWDETPSDKDGIRWQALVVPARLNEPAHAELLARAAELRFPLLDSSPFPVVVAVFYPTLRANPTCELGLRSYK